MPKFGDHFEIPEAQDERQRRAALKRRLFEEDYLDDVKALIGRRMKDPEAIGGVQANASETINFLASLTNAVAVVYDYGCRRYLRDAPEVTNAAFADIVRETDAQLLQSKWNVWAWLLGPTFAVPSIRDGAMRHTLVTPDVSHAHFNGDDVDRILWAAGNVYIEVSAEGWAYYDDKGRPVDLPEFGTDGGGRVPMNLATAPFGLFRADLPGRDWWVSTRRRGLVDGSLEACFWWAHLQWIRKSQSRHLISATCPQDKLIAGQATADPESPYLFDGEPGEAEFKVQNMIVSADEHLKMIRFIGEQIAEREGIPGAEVTFDNSSSGDLGVVSLSLRREKLAHVHRQQVPFLVKGEVETWAATVAVARAMGHRHASVLPPPDEVREMLAIEFSELEVVTDPKARLELDVEEMKLGLTSPAKIMQRRHPSLTLEECKKLQRQNVNEYAELLEFVASRNMPSTPGRATETLAEAQGRVGGQTRVQNENAREDSAA